MTLALLVVALAVSPSRAITPCLDPATPLHQLAINYDQWPASHSDRERAAFSRFNIYLRSGRSRDYRDALSAYERVRANEKEDARTLLVSGLLYAMGPDLNLPHADSYRHATAIHNANAASYAVKYLADVVRSEPGQWLAGVALARLVLAAADSGQSAKAVDALRAMLEYDPHNESIVLASSDVQLALGHVTNSLEALKAVSSSCAMFNHARAEVMMLTGDTAAGVQLYLQTLATARPADLQRYYDDIRVVANTGQLRQYAELPESMRAAWIRNFWEHSAAASSRTVETRIVEQTQRAVWADLHAREHLRFATEDQAWITDTAHVVPWTTAGVLYIRHGPPTQRLIARDDSMVSEAWIYSTVRPPWVLLMGRNVTGDQQFFWVLSPGCGRHITAFSGAFHRDKTEEKLARGDTLDLRELYVLLQQYDERFTNVVTGCTRFQGGLAFEPFYRTVGEIARDYKHLVEDITWQESSNPHLHTVIPVVLSHYTFRDAQRRSQLVAVTSIDHDAYESGHNVRYAYSFADSMTQFVRSDTIMPGVQRRATPGTTGGIVQTAVTWTEPPLRNGTLRVLTMDASDTLRGGMVQEEIAMRRDTAAFAMSDLVVAYPEVRGALVRGAYSVAPIPGNDLTTNVAFRLFFEIYGAEDGKDVEMMVTIKPSNRSFAKRRVSGAGERKLTFHTRAGKDGRGIAVGDVSINGLTEAGTYALTVSLSQGGLKSTSVIELHVADPPATQGH